MLTVGHRGASALAPENTLLAIRLAISHRLDFAEVDVHLSRDGQLVVHHDAHCTTSDGRRRPIAELTAAELAAVPKGQGQAIPTLEELLALARGRIGVYVELKAPGTAEALGALLGSTGDVPKLIGGSFSPSFVSELRRSAPDVPRSVLFRAVPPTTMIDVCRSVDARYAHPCARPVTAATIEGLHAAGLQVMTPHTNDRDEAERFRDAGADVIASDDPRVLRALQSGSRRSVSTCRGRSVRKWR